MRRPPVRFLVAAAAVLALAGCGGSSTNGIDQLEPDAILTQARAAVDDASSVHVKGTIADGGNDLVLDLTLTADGGATGTLTNQGQTLTILAVDGEAWLSADAEFWTAQQAGSLLADQLAGKYVPIPKDDTTFTGFTDWSTFWDNGLTPKGSVEKGDVTEYNGQQAQPLVQAKDGGTLYIALEGEPLPLGLDGGSGGSVTFEDWDADVTVTAPAPEDVVDPSKLGG